VEAPQLDAIDRQIIHMLTIEPRASFRAIADLVGVSDQTAARRYRRLAEEAGLRVLGTVNESRVGWTRWFLRLTTTPGGAAPIAEALALRDDTQWVHLVSGGTEVTCALAARSPEQRDELFLRSLPGSRRVVRITAHSILHSYAPGAWHGIACALSAAQLARLRPAEPVAAAASQAVGLLPGDEPLLAELARDGRTSSAALAAAVHWHESTVRRRIHELSQAGLLRFEVDIDDKAFGIHVRAALWLSVEPARLDEAGKAIAAHPEIPFAGAATGPANLIATGLFRDTDHLYRYVTGDLANLPGVRSAETVPILRTLKRTGLVNAPAERAPTTR
jgi:DNA-binding Lrp family transcriptional regulator